MFGLALRAGLTIVKRQKNKSAGGMTEPSQPSISTDICVIGAGTGGLSVAAGAAQLGAEIVLVDSGGIPGERHGNLSSRALLTAAHAAHAASRALPFGIRFPLPEIDRPAVARHIDDVVAGVASQDSLGRFAGLDVRVVHGRASFTGPRSIAVAGREIAARRFVVATGSRPIVPTIPGLDRIPYFTAETIAAETTPIAHLVVIGAGDTGTELAQAQARLGAKVTLVDRARLLPQEDPDLVDYLRLALNRDGVDLREGQGVLRVARGADGTSIEVHLADNLGHETALHCSHLLVATGRCANIGDLGCNLAGIALQQGAIQVDRRQRTSNPRIYAIGDCVGGPALAHLATYQAGIALRNILFRLPARMNPDRIPHVIPTEPEIAYVGLSESAARARFKDGLVERLGFEPDERAQTMRSSEGLIKLVLRRNGTILGVGIVGPQAGELLAPWCLALAQDLKLSAIAGLLLPHPTLAEISKRAAGNFYAPRLSGPGVRAIVRGLLRFA